MCIPVNRKDWLLYEYVFMFNTMNIIYNRHNRWHFLWLNRQFPFEKDIRSFIQSLSHFLQFLLARYLCKHSFSGTPFNRFCIKVVGVTDWMYFLLFALKCCLQFYFLHRLKLYAGKLKNCHKLYVSRNKCLSLIIMDTFPFPHFYGYNFRLLAFFSHRHRHHHHRHRHRRRQCPHHYWIIIMIKISLCR